MHIHEEPTIKRHWDALPWLQAAGYRVCRYETGEYRLYRKGTDDLIGTASIAQGHLVCMTDQPVQASAETA
jgi:predicted metalloprotease